MTSTTSTFTPSTQILEAAEKAQALADAGKPIARFLSPEIQETVDGVDKIANALKSTGEALRHFGFDEAEPEVTSSDQSFTIEPPSINPIDHYISAFSAFPPSTFVIAGGQALQENGWTGTGQAIENAGQVMRSFGFDEAEEDSITGGGQTMDTDGDDEGAVVTITLKELLASVRPINKPFIGDPVAIGSNLIFSYGTQGTALAPSDVNNDEGLAQPYIPEVGVDALA